MWILTTLFQKGRKLVTFNKMAYRFVFRMNAESLWAFLISGLSALWMNFQEIHHLIYSILFILAVNLLLATINSVKHCYIRRKRKRPFRLSACISETGVFKILLEFAVCSFGLFTISGMDLLLSMDGHTSPEFIDVLLQWITIFALILYGGMAFKRLGDLAPDLMIVKGVKYFLSKVSWWKKVPFGDDIEEDIKSGKFNELLNESKK